MQYDDLDKLAQIEVTEVLTQFGLNEKDREVYLSMLGSGQITISPLSNMLGYPLTTVQSILKKLADRGMVSVSKRKTRHIYEANDPKTLKTMLDRRIQEVENIIPILGKLRDGEDAEAKIRIYFRERMADVFHEALGCRDKLIYEIVSAGDLQKILGEKFHFTRRRVKSGIRLKSLRVEEYEIKKYNKNIHSKELREAKFLPHGFVFKSSVILWDDKVAFFTAKREGLAWIVESKSLGDMMKQIFDSLWSVSRKMETAAG
jgi:sugar-specific transcriptional regulator TrmB